MERPTSFDQPQYSSCQYGLGLTKLALSELWSAQRVVAVTCGPVSLAGLSSGVSTGQCVAVTCGPVALAGLSSGVSTGQCPQSRTHQIHSTLTLRCSPTFPTVQ